MRTPLLFLLAMSLFLSACLADEDLDCPDGECVGSEQSELDLYPVFPDPPGPIVEQPKGPCPTITSFSPGSGWPGDSVTITLSEPPRYALRTSLDWLRFGGPSGRDATFTRVSATEVHATVPAGAQTGTIAIGCYIYLTGATSVIESSQTYTVTAGTLSLENRAQYSILGFTLDGQAQSIGQVAPGATFQLPQPLAAGSHSYVLELGAPGFGVMYSYSGTVWVASGQRANLYAPRITVSQALTDGRGYRDFEGSYVDQYGGHTLLLRFYANSNTYDLWLDNSYVGSDNVTEVLWQNNSPWITFSLGSDVSDTTSGYPHASFTADNALDASGQRRTILYTATN